MTQTSNQQQAWSATNSVANTIVHLIMASTVDLSLSKGLGFYMNFNICVFHIDASTAHWVSPAKDLVLVSSTIKLINETCEDARPY